jgi:hypothetical protein
MILNKKNALNVILLGILLCFSSISICAQNWQPKKSPLKTKFAENVNPENVLPEYPRPQMVRKEWKNLNGLWQFQPGTWQNESYPKGKLNRNILVPFAVESALSGVMEQHERLWYRREFTIPTDWSKQKVLLHFGAVDYECEIFINDKSVGKHIGGYDPFSFDITDFLRQGTQTITVKVFDPTSKEGIPRGKQSLNPQGIMYTSVTGIWQTVWLEPIPEQHIVDFKMTPDIDQSVLNLSVNSGDQKGLTYTAIVKDNGKVISTVTSKPLSPTAIKIKNPKLWSPDSPFLYDLTINLKDQNGNIIDRVDSYFGMRKISIEKDGEFYRMHLNNKFVFQYGPLDQGFWPEGLYTAPTEEALKYDLEVIKKLGFNMVRKHIKVEPYRWYYWADKLGLMVWQDMPSANSYTDNTPPIDKEAFTNDLTRMIKTHWNSPSIVSWIIFNESQGQHDIEKNTMIAKGLDPYRVVNEGSGGTNIGVGDINDIHAYPPPASPKSEHQALVCGEFGGIGYQKGTLWNPNDLMEYVKVNNEKEYFGLYEDFATMLTKFKSNKGLSGAVYTEIADVEIELNGIMNYERQLKIDANHMYKVNQSVIHDNIFEYVYDVFPTAENISSKWQYTTKEPGNDWIKKNFDDSKWETGYSGFGTKDTPGGIHATEWNTSEIWLRKEFELNNLNSNLLDQLKLRVHHDEDCEIYINGILAAKLDNYTSTYQNMEISKEAKNALQLNGKNIIAIYCKQKTGGQYIDAGLTIVSDKKLKLNKALQQPKK